MSHFNLFHVQDQFLEAARRNNFEKIEQLLNTHTDVIVCRRAAEEAAEFNAVECVKLLLPHCGNHNFDYAITTAAVRGDSDLVEALVSRYPPTTVDAMRLQRAYQNTVCERSLLLLRPYLSSGEKFSFLINIEASMSVGFVEQFVEDMDPLFADSLMLTWGALYNDGRFDALYPISDPVKALAKLSKISAVTSEGKTLSTQDAAARIEARMQKDILEQQVGGVSPRAAKSKI